MSDLELREHLRQGHGEVAATEAPKGFTMLMWHDLLHILGQMTCAHIHSAEMGARRGPGGCWVTWRG